MTHRLRGISLLDNEQDKAGATNVRRWRVFRSTVAFALQESFPLESLTILWQPALKGQEAFLARICADIRTRLAERGRHLDLRVVPVAFPDPFNLQDCFQVLWEVLEKDSDEDAQVLFNANNGTHTMQMAMFLLAKYRPGGRPIHLLQVFRDRGIPEPLPAVTWAAQTRRLDMRWENLRPLERQVRRQKTEIHRAISLKRSRHPQVERLFREIVDIGCYTDDPLLLTGPTGTGKSRIAEEIHRGWARRSGRPRAPFFELNAAGLSGDLIRSTLFGHVRGAFTGAIEDRDGFLLAADQGTLFLDEIGELDLRSQAELLLAIETRSFFPVGSTRRRTSNFRLLCATNQDLRQSVRNGTFREDLYMRIRCWEFHLPGIRELPRDFEENLEFELRLFNSEEFRKENPQPFQVFFEEEAKRAYLDFGVSEEALWTGNFRDLKFSLRRLAVKARLTETSITRKMVAEEIARLRVMWNPGFPDSEGSGLTTSGRGSPKPAIPDQSRDAPPLGTGPAGHRVEAQVSLSPTSIGGELTDLLGRMEALVRGRHPHLNLLDALEATLLTECLDRLGNKAKAARRLYEPPGKPLANPSNRFRERFKSLFSKGRPDSGF